MPLRSSCTNCTSKRTNTRDFMNGVQSSLRICRLLQASWKDPDCAEIERSSTGSPIRTFATRGIREYNQFRLEAMRDAQPVDEQQIQRFQSPPKTEVVNFYYPPKHSPYQLINPPRCKPWCETCAFEKSNKTFDIEYFHWEIEFEKPEVSIVLIHEDYPETSIYARRMRSLRETTHASSYCTECTEYLRLKRMVNGYSTTAELRRSQIHHYTDSPYTKDSFAYLIDMYIRANMAYDWVSRLDVAYKFIDKRRKVHSRSNTSRRLAQLYECVQQEFDHALLQDITVMRLHSHCDNFEAYEAEWFDLVFVE